MAAIDFQSDRLATKTVGAIVEAYRTRTHTLSKPARHSSRLGASTIGKPCARQLWYEFRWFLPPEEFEGQIHRLFDRGHFEEDWLALDLRSAGATVHETDQRTGEQFEFTECDGHLVAKLDGAAVNLPDAPKTWHSLELKTHNRKSFDKLKAKGVLESKPEHYAQCVIGMGLSGLTRCLYLAVCKDTDELYGERFRWEECKDDFKALIERARLIINARTAPARISANPDSPECRYCRFKDVCHGNAQQDLNCRTCKDSLPIADGQWKCTKHQRTLTTEDQCNGCDTYQLIGITLPSSWAKPTSAPAKPAGKPKADRRLDAATGIPTNRPRTDKAVPY